MIEVWVVYLIEEQDDWLVYEKNLCCCYCYYSEVAHDVDC